MSAGPTLPTGIDSPIANASERYALTLSGGGVRATVFHLGVLLWLAAQGRLERVHVLSTVSGGSLAAGLVLSSNHLRWPSSEQFIDGVLQQAKRAITEHSLQSITLFRTLRQPWKFAGGRGNLFAAALEDAWGIHGTMKEIGASPRWFINATCLETAKNWRFSQHHLGDWKFGHNYTQAVPLSIAMASSAAIPYMADFVKLDIEAEGWFKIDPGTDEPQSAINPPTKSVRLWDGGLYENLGIEAVYKPQREFVDKSVTRLIVSDASAYLADRYRESPGVLMARYPYIRPPRMFEIISEQTRSLRTRFLMDSIQSNRLTGSIVRLGVSVMKVDNAVARTRSPSQASCFLDEQQVAQAAKHPTDGARMKPVSYANLLRHGFETADATLTAYQPEEFESSMLWTDLPEEVRDT